MKALFILTVAPVLVLACSHTESTPAGDAAQTQQLAAQPAVVTEAPVAAPDTPAAAAPDAAVPAAPSSTTTQAGATAAAATAGRSPGVKPAAPSPPPNVVTPPTPPVPQFRDVTIPAGTALSVTVLSHLGSTTSQIEDPVKGALANPVVIAGTTALPQNTALSGFVTDVKTSGRVKGKASLAFRFDRLSVRGETHQIQTARVIRGADDKKTDDVKKGGVGAGLGAVVGGIAGGGKGAAIGAVAGGAGTVLGTKGKEVEMPAGTVVEVLVQEPVVVRVPLKQ
jgi:hypothetical protein